MNHCYRFTRHVYHVMADQRLVLLDARRDRYLFIDPDHLPCLLAALREPDFKQHDAPSVQAAIRARIIEPATSPQALNIVTTRPQGIGLHPWRLPEGEPPALTWPEIISMGNVYLSVRAHIRCRGLHALLNKIQASIRQGNARCSDMSGMEAYCRKIRQFGLYLPFRTACLENALVTAILLSRRAIPVELKIGIQLDPFLAHAWVNVHGQVVLDKSDLNQSMMTMVRIQ